MIIGLPLALSTSSGNLVPSLAKARATFDVKQASEVKGVS